MDGGDFIHRSGKDNVHESLLTWNEMVRTGYQAVTLGELEFGQWDLVDSLMRATPLPVVCTNVEALREGQWLPVGERFRILEINGIRVGVLGVVGPTQLSPTVIRTTGDRVRLLPPEESVRTAVAEIREQTDLIVLLAHLDPQAMEQYGASLAEVDVIVGGHMTTADTGPQLASRSIINRGSTRGQYMAVTRLILSPEGRLVDFGGLNFTLDPEFPEDPAVAQAAENAKATSDRLIRERHQRREQPSRSATPEPIAPTDPIAPARPIAPATPIAPIEPITPPGSSAGSEGKGGGPDGQRDQ